MKILCSNESFFLVSNEQFTTLYKIPSFEKISQISQNTKKAYLQYGTGIAALANQSKILIYDFIYNREIYSLETYQKIERISLLKNWLIAISNERILIHDINLKTNLNYIPIHEGDLAFLNNDYYNLQIFYYSEPFLICNRSVWFNKVNHIEGIKYQYGCYAGSYVGLALKNVFSIYQNEEILKNIGFQADISEIYSSKSNFLIRIANGKLFICNAKTQGYLLEYETIDVSLWSPEYQTGIICTQNKIYQLAKGLVKVYTISRKVNCEYLDIKYLKKN